MNLIHNAKINIGPFFLFIFMICFIINNFNIKEKGWFNASKRNIKKNN